MLGTFKYLFFDLDNTLAEKCGVIPDNLVARLEELEREGKTIIVVSGATLEKVASQLNGLQPTFILAQNGNEALRREQSARTILYMPVWKRSIGETKEIYVHIAKLIQYFAKVGEAQNRGCQISYSVVGHSAPASLKRDFDPTFEKRGRALETHPFVSRTHEVSIGGTTCFDYMLRGMNKGHNVEALISANGWLPTECIYFGDSFGERGNDSSVVGVCETVVVTDPSDTHKKLWEK